MHVVIQFPALEAPGYSQMSLRDRNHCVLGFYT
jgi:hypothetical protein